MSKRITFTDEEIKYLYGLVKEDMKYISLNEPKSKLLYEALEVICNKFGYSPVLPKLSQKEKTNE